MSRFQRMVFSIAKKHGHSDEDAGDVMVMAFERLLKSLDRIESGAVLGRWLGLVAARESLRLHRTNARNRYAQWEDQDLDTLLLVIEKDAEADAIAADQALQTREALCQLPARCRSLLELLYSDEDLSYAEISTRTGVPIGALGPTRARCLVKLRELLAESGFFA